VKCPTALGTSADDQIRDQWWETVTGGKFSSFHLSKKFIEFHSIPQAAWRETGGLIPAAPG
jgi:hypothetical protein